MPPGGRTRDDHRPAPQDQQPGEAARRPGVPASGRPKDRDAATRHQLGQARQQDQGAAGPASQASEDHRPGRQRRPTEGRQQNRSGPRQPGPGWSAQPAHPLSAACPARQAGGRPGGQPSSSPGGTPGAGFQLGRPAQPRQTLGNRQRPGPGALQRLEARPGPAGSSPATARTRRPQGPASARRVGPSSMPRPGGRPGQGRRPSGSERRTARRPWGRQLLARRRRCRVAVPAPIAATAGRTRRAERATT